MIEYTYIHIPFCKSKCKYCAFLSFVNLNLIEKYVNSLLLQIEKECNNFLQKTIYFGGGTPSLLSIEQIEKIIKRFNTDKNTEITIEINPENITLEYLKNLKKTGINRLSIGVQTFCDEILSEIGRGHTKNDAINIIKLAKDAGFKNISIDLIYGLPNQTLNDLKKDLEIANSLDIEHISTYGLKIEDKTYYKKFTPKNLADDEMQAKMYKETINGLDNFNLYEISNFCKSEKYMSKHNLNYWNLTPYNGFGLGASGFDGVNRYKNTENLKEYLIDPTKKDEFFALNKQELLEETIFLGFRKAKGINIKEINEKFKIDFDKKYKNIINKYTKTGHIEKTKDGYKLTLDGILISNYILCDFLC